MSGEQECLVWRDRAAIQHLRTAFGFHAGSKLHNLRTCAETAALDGTRNPGRAVLELLEECTGQERIKVEQLQEQTKRIMAGVPEESVASTGAMRIDPNALYPRRALLAMGMSKRLVNSLASSRVQRGQYMGSAVIAALESRTKASKHPPVPSKETVQWPVSSYRRRNLGTSH